MKQLVILSGKGGTGKTTIAAAFGHLASQELSIVLADADVDAANLELVLDPTKLEEHPFVGGQEAIIDPELCLACGICEEVCRFEAVMPPPDGDLQDGDSYRVDPIACEGCGSCFYACPKEAIQMEELQAGLWFRSDTRFGPLFHAHLFAAQENSGKLVTVVKQQARSLALQEGRDLLIVDGPPGIGCPVISACSGADLALLVVEPTIAGIHDLERVLATANHFGVPSLLVINKADINPTQAEKIVAFCKSQGVQVAGLVPYDDAVTESIVNRQPVTGYSAGMASQELLRVWVKTRHRLLGGSPMAKAVLQRDHRRG